MQQSGAGEGAEPGIQGPGCQHKNLIMERVPNYIGAVHLRSPLTLSFPHDFLLSCCTSQVSLLGLGFLNSGILVPQPLMGHLFLALK